jgi:hypothetical protein
MYNGHKNWTYWNVSLWINNDEPTYRMALSAVKHYAIRKDAAQFIKDSLPATTPDGAVYTIDNIKAAIADM